MVAKIGQLTTLLVALALVGCASRMETIRAGDAADTATPAAAGGSTDATSGVAEPRAAARQPGAVALQAQASRQQDAGDYDQAAATLERALRIDADDPELWLALAEIRLAQGDASQATDLARRSASLAVPGMAVHRQALELQRRAGAMTGRGP